MADDIQRLDYSNPPPGYEIQSDWFNDGDSPDAAGVGGCLPNEHWQQWQWVNEEEDACGDWFGEGDEEMETNGPAAALTDAWSDYKGHKNPPGMWCGFYSRLPNCDVFTPRMGLQNGMELTIHDETQYATQEEAVAAGRRAAWARHDEWQREAPEKTLSEFIRDQALMEMAQRGGDA